MLVGVSSGLGMGGHLGLGPIGCRAAPLPSWIELLGDAARTAFGKPTVVLLPDISLAGVTTAILCARDLAACALLCPADVLSRLRRGNRVRVLPNEGIYEFGGMENDGFWLSPLHVRKKGTAGRFWIPEKEAARIEPTHRKRPVGKPNRHQWSLLKPTAWDQFAGSKLGGNAALATLKVVLIGSRFELADGLAGLGFADAPGAQALSVADGLPWGRLNDDGDIELLHPPDASGQALIAVARDHISARRLAERIQPGEPLLFVSVRPDDALADRTSVEILAERHACLVLAPGRLREGFLQRRTDGWLVTDLSGSPALQAEPVGIPALDRVAAASNWMRRSPGILAQPSRELEEAFRLLDHFNRATRLQIDDDDNVNEAASLLRQAFFEASDWLSAPTTDELSELAGDHETLLSLVPRLRSVAGDEAASAASDVMKALDLFAKDAAVRARTPKGDCVLRLAEKAQTSASYRQVIVAGHRSTVDSVALFLEEHRVPMTCVTPTELGALENVKRVNVLSVMRRESFTRLLEPWAAPDIMFLGYQHEVDIYQQRLAARLRMIERLRPDAAVLAKLPQLASCAAVGRAEAPGVDGPLEHDPLPSIRPAVPRPEVRSGEQSKLARFCRFSGHSWMAMSDDHAVAYLQTGLGKKTQVTTVACRDLHAGDLILVREGGEKDIVREMAEHLAGRDVYNGLRIKADHWRRALRSSGNTPERLRSLLAEEGLDRGLPTLRYWMAEEGPIGPSDPDLSIPLIAAALGEDAEGHAWNACRDAIHAVRRYHVNAGFQLTRALMEECGESILDYSDHETRFELNVGTVWLLEVEQLEEELRPWPYTQVNRLQWESEAWRRRLLRKHSPLSNLDLLELPTAPDFESTAEEI